MTQFEPERRNWVRREVDFTVTLLFPAHGVREVHSAFFLMRDLSENGASLFVGSVRNIPDFFYLQFGDERSELTGCYTVMRDNGILRCRFSTILPTAKVDEIIAHRGMTSLLNSLFDTSEHEQIEQR